MPTPESRAICSSVTGSRPDANAALAASSSRARFRSASARGRLGWVWPGLDIIRRFLRLSVTMDLPEVPPVPFHYATFGGSPMTTAGQSPDSRVPAPGGTARLAGRVVARIGFGAMQLEGRKANRETALAVLRQAVGGGVNHIDTAQFYGDCNALIRAALAPYPDDLTLVSKVGAERDAGGGLVPAQRPDQLRAQVEANLATLGAERLDEG